MPTTVSIVEDDPGTCESLAALIGETASLRCLGVFNSGEKALQGIPREKPDVVLVDIHLSDRGMNGIQCVAGLKARLAELQILMLTCHTQSNLIFDALRAGASGYLLKKRIPTELIPAIEQVRTGGAPMSPEIAHEVVGFFHAAQRSSGQRSFEELSEREHGILTLLAKGYSSKEIGEMLGITMETVRVHLKNIYRKLHVHSRTEAAAKFFGCE